MLRWMCSPFWTTPYDGVALGSVVWEEEDEYWTHVSHISQNNSSTSRPAANRNACLHVHVIWGNGKGVSFVSCVRWTNVNVSFCGWVENLKWNEKDKKIIANLRKIRRMCFNVFLPIGYCANCPHFQNFAISLAQQVLWVCVCVWGRWFTCIFCQCRFLSKYVFFSRERYRRNVSRPSSVRFGSWTPNTENVKDDREKSPRT